MKTKYPVIDGGFIRDSHRLSKSGFIIEFFGLSGVGKTTLAKELTEELENRGLPVNSYFGKSLFFIDVPAKEVRKKLFSRFIFHPIKFGYMFITLTAAICNGKSIYGGIHYKKDVLLKWLKRWVLYIDSVNSLKNTKQFSILDRGLATNIMSIITRIDIENIAPMCRALISTGILPNLLIVVDAKRGVIEERRKNRGDEEKFWQSSWDYEYKKYSQILEVLDRELKKTNGKLIRVDSNDTDNIKNNVIEICKYLTNSK
jgi:thymidylate kinase